MGALLTPELTAELPPATRAALLAVLDQVEGITGLIQKLTAAVAALDELDDRREAQINELRLTVRLLCQAQGIETKGEPLVDLIRSYTEPRTFTEGEPDPRWSPEQVRAYHQTMQLLREQRDEAERGEAS